jgi:hypothetical protein
MLPALPALLLLLARGAAAADPALPRNGWTATADSTNPGNPPSNVLDNPSTTFWHTQWQGSAPDYPHYISIIMGGQANTVSGLKYTPRTDYTPTTGGPNGCIGKYEVRSRAKRFAHAVLARVAPAARAGGRHWRDIENACSTLGTLGRALHTAAFSVASQVTHRSYTGTLSPIVSASHRVQVHLSTDGTTYGAAVTSGTWADSVASKTVTFTAAANVKAVRLVALSEAGNRGPWASAGDIQIFGTASTPSGGGTAGTLSRAGWSVAASDAETVAENGAPANLIDGDTSTIWHSKWANGAVALPHAVTLNMGGQLNDVSGITYLPRQVCAALAAHKHLYIVSMLVGRCWPS